MHERINMSKSYIKDEYGKIVAVRYTRADGRRSWDYEYDSSKLIINQGKCISVNDHHKDGTTTSYEYKPGFISELLYDGKGKKSLKNTFHSSLPSGTMGARDSF